MILAFSDNVWNAGISKSRHIYTVKKVAFVFSFLKKHLLLLYTVKSNTVTAFIVSSLFYMQNPFSNPLQISGATGFQIYSMSLTASHFNECNSYPSTVITEGPPFSHQSILLLTKAHLFSVHLSERWEFSIK